MIHLRRRRRAASLLALLAVLAYALVPTLSRAWAPPAGPGSLAEVCTPQGLQRLPLDAPRAPAHGDACALCALGGAGVLPAADGAALPLPDLAAANPTLPDGLLPAQRRDWRQAPPRAPPAA